MIRRLLKGRCLPWRHDWTITRHMATAESDLGARGELWRCKKCPAVKAK
jgi:hypothetical protein